MKIKDVVVFKINGRWAAGNPFCSRWVKLHMDESTNAVGVLMDRIHRRTDVGV